METGQSQKESRGSSQRGRCLLRLLCVEPVVRERTMSVESVVSDPKGPREDGGKAYALAIATRIFGDFGRRGPEVDQS